MRTELDEALVRDFPNLYRARYVKNEPFQFGFECGDGWEPIIRQLSSQLEQLILELPASEQPEYYAVQVKEKFGTLRFIMSSQKDEFDSFIQQAENKSANTCEECGCDAQRRSTGSWLRTECEQCYVIRTNRRLAESRKFFEEKKKLKETKGE